MPNAEIFMPEKLLYSIVESPSHPVFTALYTRLGFTERRFSTQRKAISELKTTPAEIVVAEFFYGFGNNYAGVNVSNLDVMLMSLQRYAPATRVLVLAQKDQYPYLHKLEQLFTLHQVIPLPITEPQMQQRLLDYKTSP